MYTICINKAKIFKLPFLSQDMSHTERKNVLPMTSQLMFKCMHLILAERNGINSYPKFAAYFLVITLLKALAVYPDQLRGEKSISNHGYQITIVTIPGCSFKYIVSK
jgi:hypothetical protein